MIILGRRQFIKLCGASIGALLLAAQRITKAKKKVQPEASPWAFPLQFPAYFEKDEPIERYRVYLPTVMRQ